MLPAGWRQAPPEIETDRLLLRCPREKDGPQLYCAISELLPELRPWFAWAADLAPTADNFALPASSV